MGELSESLTVTLEPAMYWFIYEEAKDRDCSKAQIVREGLWEAYEEEVEEYVESGEVPW